MASRPFPPTCPSRALSPNSTVTTRPSCFLLLPSSSCPWPFKRFFLNCPGLEGKKRCKVSVGSGREKSEAQRAAWGGGGGVSWQAAEQSSRPGCPARAPGAWYQERSFRSSECLDGQVRKPRGPPHPGGLQKAVTHAHTAGCLAGTNPLRLILL